MNQHNGPETGDEKLHAVVNRAVRGGWKLDVDIPSRGRYATDWAISVEFAKAFWGSAPVPGADDRTHKLPPNPAAWQYYLEQLKLVPSDERIDWLYEFVKNEGV